MLFLFIKKRVDYRIKIEFKYLLTQDSAYTQLLGLISLDLVALSHPVLDQAVEKGWTDAQSLNLMSHALREWSQHPDGIFAQAWCEAVGQKD